MRRLRALPLVFLCGAAAFAAEIAPLVQAHAHNDYEHPRPLLDALDHGFCSIEADIYLVGGRLLVAHDLKDTAPERTLEALYLDPLQRRVSGNDGRVYRAGPSITLMIDVKSEGAATYAVLHETLRRYAGMLTAFHGTEPRPGAVTVIVSGNRVPEIMAAQRDRLAAVDGRRADLEANPPALLVPLVSENWNAIFSWKWEGPMPEAERQALAQWVVRAHQQGRKVRFWNTPDRPDAWKILRAAGVDIIGTDDLAALGHFLRGSLLP